jgi:hypothetical protein
MSANGDIFGVNVTTRLRQLAAQWIALWPATRRPTQEDLQAQELARNKIWGNAIDDMILREIALAGSQQGGGVAITSVAAVPLSAGMPVYIDRGTFQAKPASAAVGFQSFVAGFAATSVGGGVAVQIVRSSLTMTEWNAICGVPFLQPGQGYYLGSAAGQITLAPPSARGQSLVSLGTAISSTTLVIDIAPPILL